MIVKDEEGNLGQCLDSVRAHVDELIVVDTGSTDRTREIAIQHGAHVHQFDHRNHPEAFFLDDEATCKQFGAPGAYSGEWALADFGAARNESFKHATCDYVMWIDADDVLEQPEKIREVVADMEARNVGMAFLSYNYAQDHLGRVYYRQWRERIFRRNTADWVNPVHEVLIPRLPISMPTQYPAPIYSHRRKADRKSIPHRNYKILLRQAWQLKTANPSAKLDPRILFYLGQEARFVEPQRAIGFYEEYLQISGWPEERAAAHNAIGNMLEMGLMPIPPETAMAQANREYAASAAEMSTNPDGFFGLARIAYLRQRWQDCVNYSERAFAIGNTESMLGANPMDRLYRPHVYYNHALANLNRLEEAAESCRAALKVLTDDPGVPGGASGMLTHNLKIYESELARRAAGVNRPAAEPPKGGPVEFDVTEDLNLPPLANIPRDAMAIWSIQLWKQIVSAGDMERAAALLRALPHAIEWHPVVEKMKAITKARTFPAGQPASAFKPAPVTPTRADGTLDVVLWTGPAPEPWSPATPNEKGLGGSETAAIEMAKHLTALGHRVVVFAECMGTYEGVEYRHYSTFKGAACDVFIASRAPWAIDQFGPVNAKIKLLWVHDIHCGPPSPQMERWLYKFDRILCLSEWHKGYFLSVYPSVHADRVTVTRNGIDPARFSSVAPKKNSLVFSSSPNRGLDWLVANFRTAIKPAVPDAELHIYYGFDTWETMAKQRGDAGELAEIERYKQLLPPLGTDAGGIFNHGKRPQSEVAAAYAQAKVWPYLTQFPETSCITAMEAQAAGCVPVCSKFAALAETVKHGIFLDNEDPKVAQTFVDEVIRMLKNDVARDAIAQTGRAYALANLSWAALAKDWSEMFISLSRCEDEIPMWRSA